MSILPSAAEPSLATQTFASEVARNSSFAPGVASMNQPWPAALSSNVIELPDSSAIIAKRARDRLEEILHLNLDPRDLILVAEIVPLTVEGLSRWRK